MTTTTLLKYNLKHFFTVYLPILFFGTFPEMVAMASGVEPFIREVIGNVSLMIMFSFAYYISKQKKFIVALAVCYMTANLSTTLLTGSFGTTVFFISLSIGLLVLIANSRLFIQVFNYYMGYLIWNTGAHFDAVIVVFMLQTIQTWATRIFLGYFRYYCDEKAQEAFQLHTV